MTSWRQLPLVVAIVIPACGFRVGGTLDDARQDGGADSPPVLATDWWDPAYPYRVQINVAASSKAIPIGYAVMLPVDTASLISSGHTMSQADFRVVRYLGPDLWSEIDRWIEDVPARGWNTSATRTWFKLPVALGANTTDGDTWLYYGGLTTNAPKSNVDNIFLFADTFENGLSKWEPNLRNETVTADLTTAAGGAASLKLVTNGGDPAGLHKDLGLPITPLMFSHHLRQQQTSASLGAARAFDATWALRQKSWVEGELRLATELDSGDRMQVWADGSLQNWFAPVGVNTWREIETVFDVAANTVRTRANGGAWAGPFVSQYKQGTAIKSFAVEGEGGQSGTFWIDNFIVRPFVDPEPVAALGVEQMHQ